MSDRTLRSTRMQLRAEKMRLPQLLRNISSMASQSRRRGKNPLMIEGSKMADMVEAIIRVRGGHRSQLHNLHPTGHGEKQTAAHDDAPVESSSQGRSHGAEDAAEGF